MQEMEREALVAKQGSFSFAICLLALGLGNQARGWTQDDPAGPAPVQATEKKPTNSRPNRDSIATLD